MTSEQIAIRLPQELLSELDDLVTAGAYESRAAAVRAGVGALVARQRSRRLDDAIVEGYRRTPPTGAEGADALASLRDAIAEEPWS